jgi:predicted O-linked N-acetylglucosamine transferase (SPINDLY family)
MAASALQRTFESGVAEHRAGRFEQAERLYASILRQDPQHEQARFLSAAIALETGRYREALELLAALLKRQPNNAFYWTNIGEAHRRLGENERAVWALSRAATLKPDLAQAHFNLGLAACSLGELALAVPAFERATELEPQHAQMQHRLALALVEQGEYRAAIGHFQCAVLGNPSWPQLLCDYASCLRHAGRLDAAHAAASRALELAPKDARGYDERSAIRAEQGRCDEALADAEVALSLEPSLASAHTRVAAVLADTGRVTAALAAYRKAVELEPDNHLAHGNLVFLESFRPGSTPQSILHEACAWAERHAAPLASKVREHRNAPDPERRLRIGYVSSNFNDHCQALFTRPLFEKHDRRAFEVVAFSSTKRRDHVTRELRGHFDDWHEIADLDPVAAAEHVRAHGVDILVDLTMHMAESLLRIFACKPAPVQIAWLAYPGTTGLGAMDYRVTDRHLDPPELVGSGEAYTEAPLVLPDTFWCYAPGAGTPPVSALPALANGYVTFGCLNGFWKLNEGTLALWARALRQLPTSRLLLLGPEGGARARLLDTLRGFGIDAARVEVVSRRPRVEYLKLYGEIDIGLDALPYNGHTTSLDSFWMGVPVVTLVGQTVVGRAGLCQARNLDLPELIAESPEAFVAAAARLARDLGSLEKLRAGLRERMQRSPLMDAGRFARNLEAKYREAWRHWCASRG